MKTTVKKSKTPKYVLKSITVAKRAAGKTAMKAAGKKNAAAMKKAGKGARFQGQNASNALRMELVYRVV